LQGWGVAPTIAEMLTPMAAQAASGTNACQRHLIDDVDQLQA
jgi:hypothetical protein